MFQQFKNKNKNCLKRIMTFFEFLFLFLEEIWGFS